MFFVCFSLRLDIHRIQDQEKINSQQKSLREQEQERQWKQLQAMRARDQQMQHLVIHDQKLQQGTKRDDHNGTTTIFTCLSSFSVDLHVATNQDMMGGVGLMASPNSRPGFIAPASKNRVIIAGAGAVVGQTPQSPLPMSPAQQQQPGFQHPSMSRPVSVQIPRPGQLQQQRMQSPFSPQQQHPPQSPHDQFPLSPATQANNGDPFSRPSSENSQQDPYLNVCNSFYSFFDPRRRHL